MLCHSCEDCEKSWLSLNRIVHASARWLTLSLSPPSSSTFSRRRCRSQSLPCYTLSETFESISSISTPRLSLLGCSFSLSINFALRNSRSERSQIVSTTLLERSRHVRLLPEYVWPSIIWCSTTGLCTTATASALPTATVFPTHASATATTAAFVTTACIPL